MSNGQVSGLHDRMSAINTLKCVGITRRYQIAQEKDMGNAVKLPSIVPITE